MSMHTRVVFKDGTEKTAAWSPGYWTPARALTEAVRSAEISQGEPHNGAWLEFHAEAEAAGDADRD